MRLAKIFILILLMWAVEVAKAQQQLTAATKVPSHPRLLLPGGMENAIATNIQSADVWKKIHQTIITECNNTLAQPPVKQIKIGRRLLDKSRTCL